ncbi:MAG: hypothetical protein ABI386_09425 [Rhodanobacter sp.]
MIELEIQALSERREGLLVEVGRLVLAHGFTLQRQRLVQDPHGILLTIVVRGPARKKRTLEAAIAGHERIISFKIEPFVDGEVRPHFAASRAQSNYVPAPAPEPAAGTPAVAKPASAATSAAATVPFDEIEPARLTASSAPTTLPASALIPPSAVKSQPAPDLEFIQPQPAPVPATPPVVEAPFVDLVPLEPDQAGVDKVLSKLATEYPQIVPRLLKLDQSVSAGARESSLRLAGQRIGAWVFEQNHTPLEKLDLDGAIARIGTPAMRALVEVEQDGRQLHIHNSPLCARSGHSGCMFYSGFLDGVLGSALTSSELLIFPVCCRSYGADDCVLALSD